MLAAMLRISSTDIPPSSLSPSGTWPLYSTQTTRQIEQAYAQALPPHTLMQRAGLAVAQLAVAITPHAQRIWIACGPGNNGGDGFEAAAQLKALLPHTQILVSEVRERHRLPADAQASCQRAQQAGVQWLDACPDDLGPQDLCIDALLGIGLRSTPTEQTSPKTQRLFQLLEQIWQSPCPVLCVDIASGLDADTGQYPAAMNPPHTSHSPRHTLALLTLQPGHFTAQSRDAGGQIWWDDLGCNVEAKAVQPTALLSSIASLDNSPRSHASHKGSYGDVAILGGEGLAHRGMGMTGAAWLAALAALHTGAGRIMLALLDAQVQGISPWPEIMLRQPQAQNWGDATVVCGCGGGTAIEAWLAQVLTQAPRLVLDADALNVIATGQQLALTLAQRASKNQATILTPHPLEAARLLQTDTTTIQADRLQACTQLAQKYQCVALLKGSGTVIANTQGERWINSSGNARLATGGTGDVLAGLIGALWAQGRSPEQAAIEGAFVHGHTADIWPANLSFSASALALRLGCAK
jgi:hydroxyethylthiazole kinase-like uncharacterized protein yjeF